MTIAGIPRIALSAPSPSQDVRILNLVLVLEWLEELFYTRAVTVGDLEGELRQYAKVVSTHERAHAAFLEKTLGSAARQKPGFDLGDSVRDPGKFTAAALALEDLSVAAYNGQATNLTKAALGAAARIVSVEARHAAWIRFIAGEVPAPKPVDEPVTANQVTARLRQLGFVKSG